MNDDSLVMVHDCEKRDSQLSDWELGFVGSLRGQLENGRTLSEKQAGILDDLWDRVTKDG